MKPGTRSRTHTTSRTARTTGEPKAVRLPTAPAGVVPAGRPSARARVIPAGTTAMARPRRAAGTIRTAQPTSIAHSVPPMASAGSRAAKVSAYDDDSATGASLTANPSTAPHSTSRRDSPCSAVVPVRGAPGG